MEVLALIDDFSKGFYGDNPNLGAGYFGGYNFIRTTNGAMKIREGTGLLSSTGMANALSIATAPVTGGIFLTTGTPTWFVPLGGGAPTGLTALAVSAVAHPHDWCAFGNTTLFTVDTDKTYEVSAAAVVGLTGSPGGAFVATLNDRIYVANMTGTANRIQWSDKALKNSWTAGNILDVGTTNDTICLMRRQRDSLIIATTSASTFKGTTNWYRLSGEPGLDQTLVPITPRGPMLKYGLPRQEYLSCEGSGSRVWLAPGLLDTVGGWVGWIDADVPVVSNQLRFVNTIVDTYTSADSYGVAASTHYPLALLQDNLNVVGFTQRSLLWQAGVWQQMQFNYSNSFNGSSFSTVTGDGYFYLSNGGDASTKPYLQIWRVDNTLAAPALESDAGSHVVTAQLDTPIVHDPANREMRVQAVAVDYIHYSSTTTLSCFVETYGIRDTNYSTSSQLTYTPGTAGLSNLRERHTFYVGDAPAGTAFLVKLFACKAVAIERITVLGEYEDSRT